MQPVVRKRKILLDPGGRLLYPDDSEAGPAGPGAGMRVETYACEEPECPWMHVRLTALEPEAEGATCSARIHKDTREVFAGDAKGRASRVAGLFRRLEELVAAPDGSLLEILRRRWRRARGRREQTWRGRDWSDWSPGELVSYKDIDGDAPDTVFISSGRTVWVDDSHCIAAGCDCRDVLLHFEAVGDGAGESLGALRLDLSSGGLGEAATGREARSGDLGELWRALLEAHPDARKRFKRHRDHARRVAPQIRRRAGHHGPEPVSGAQRVGRNDPCPCGSGRKYKRCCL